MPKARTIASAQNKAISSGFLDLMGSNTEDFKPVTFDTLANSLAYVAGIYTQKLAAELVKKDADSSGSLADSIVPLDVQILGSVYSVEISANKYAKFIDEGVSGWKKQQAGSPFQFKTKGVNPDGPMVKAIKKWLVREGKIGAIKHKRTISKREGRRARITDVTTKAAISTAYMIKRQGIKPTHFWRDATKDMASIIKTELAAALKVDIIQNLTNN